MNLYWDAYNCTVREETSLLLASLRCRFRDQVSRTEKGAGIHGFRSSFAAYDPLDVQVYRALSGGNEWPHVQSQGCYSPAMSEFVRQTWPDHWVSRADAAFDLTGRGVFDELIPLLDEVARSSNLSWSTVGDWRPDGSGGNRGRTLYIGSRHSAFLVRVYEKGLQVFNQLTEFDDPVDVSWVRVEAEVKPGTKDGRLALARCSPLDAWGMSKWGSKVLDLIAGVSPPRQVTWSRKLNDSYSAVRHMALQYRKAMGHVLINENDGWEGFARFVRQVWDEQDRDRGFDIASFSDDGPLPPASLH